MKKFLLVVIGLLVLAVAGFFAFYEASEPPAPLLPAPTDPIAAAKLQGAIAENYCGDAQQVVTLSSIAVDNQLHLNFNSFVKSKPSAKPLTTHQFLHYLPLKVNGAEQAFPAIVSCKLKTAERINTENPGANATADLSCRHLLERDVASVLAGLDPELLAFPAEDIGFNDDEMANQGRTWLAPWPYAVARAENGKLVWQSKAMLIDYSILNPMPARFLGTHYCHLPTPQYIEAVLLGDITDLAGS